MRFVFSSCRFGVFLLAMVAVGLGPIGVLSGEKPVTVWPDRSLHGNHATHGGGGPIPVVAPGVTPAGGNAVRFNGTLGQHLAIPASESLESPRFSWYFVFRPGALDQGRILNSAYADFNPNPAQTAGSYAGWGSMPAANGRLRAQVRKANADFEAAEVSGLIRTDDFFIGSARWDPLAGTGQIEAVAISRSGERRRSVVNGANGIAQGHLFTWIGSGAGHGSGNPASPYTGDIAEILVFNRKLTDAEQAEMEAYLADRHFAGEDASLPISHGLVLWLDAADLVTSTVVPPDPVARTIRWSDRSGQANHALPPPVEHQLPRLARGVTATGGDALRFDGEAEFLEIPGNPSDFDGPGRTWYLVFRPDALDGGRLLNSAYHDIDPGSSTFAHYSAWGSTVSSDRMILAQASRFNDGSLVTIGEGDLTAGASEFVIAGNRWDSATGELKTTVIAPGGNREVAATSGANAVPGGHLFTRIGAGSAQNRALVTARYSGDIAEILIYNRLLSEAEQRSVERYLRAKHFGETAPEGFAAWRIDYFGPEAGEDPAISGPWADPLGVGMVNLLRYAFAVEPGDPHPRASLPEIDHAGEDGVFLIYLKRKEAFDLVFQPEVSDDLATWESGPDHTEIVEIEDLGEVERVTVRAKNLPGENGRGFMRLRVELTEDLID